MKNLACPLCHRSASAWNQLLAHMAANHDVFQTRLEYAWHSRGLRKDRETSKHLFHRDRTGLQRIKPVVCICGYHGSLVRHLRSLRDLEAHFIGHLIRVGPVYSEEREMTTMPGTGITRNIARETGLQRRRSR